MLDVPIDLMVLLSGFLSRYGKFIDDLPKTKFSISASYKPETGSDSNKYDCILSRNNDEKLSCPDKYVEWSLGLYDCKRAVLQCINMLFGTKNVLLLTVVQNMMLTI